ncbi:MAG: hypothetical protein AAGF12_36325 [Myxococcota bacterium]
MDHDTILDMLLKLRKKQYVHLVSRMVVPGSRVTRGKVWFFFPDFHLLSAKAEQKYTYGFTHFKDVPSFREPLLLELCKKLKVLGAGQGRNPKLYVYQLGDFIDVWREDKVEPIEDMNSMVRRALAANPAASRYLADQRTLGAFLVLGNHDHVGDLSLRRVPRTRRMRTAYALPPKGNVIATHGDLFDPIERLPDPFSRWGSRFTTIFTPGTYKMRGAKRLSQDTEISGDFRVSTTHGLKDGTTEYATAMRLGRKWALRNMKLNPNYRKPVQVFVIGHTHKPKIAQVRHDLVIMDCGAWLQQCDLGACGVVPQCQVGVLAMGDGGLDLRVYQLTPRELSG